MSTPQAGPIRVLYLITELSTGGAQVALFRLLSGLDRSAFSPHIACWYNGAGSVAQRIRSLGYPVTDLKMSAKWRMDAFSRLFLLIRQFKPHILHTWLFHANIPGRIIGRMAGVPHIVSSERTMEMEGHVRLLLNRFTSPLAERITCVSQNVARFALQKIKISPSKITVIPNGIDIKDFASQTDQTACRTIWKLPAQKIILGAAGRLEPVKNYPLLLRAFASLVQQNEAIHLAIAGNGPEASTLAACVHELQITDSVTFLGNVEEIPAFLSALDIFILSSHFEGMPNSILEAMAAGLPVVATAVGGTPEVVIPGETGFLVQAGNTKDLASAIQFLLHDPALRQQFGQAGRQRVATFFSQETTVTLTQKLYRDLMM